MDGNEQATRDDQLLHGCSAIHFEAAALNADCCSFAFSPHLPGVVDCLSSIDETWNATMPEGQLCERRTNDRGCLVLTRQLWALGDPAGPSSGLHAAAALDVLEEKAPGHRVVTVFPDRMERDFSHKVFEGLRCG